MNLSHPSNLYAPEVVFLLLIMNMIGWNGDAEGIGLSHGKRPWELRGRGGTSCGCNCCGQRLEERSGRGGGLVGVADQFEQVMIFDVLDFIGEADEAAIDVIECAAVELVAKLFAADGERVTSRVLAQHEFGVR